MAGGTTFYQWLKQRRKALDYTQKDLADLAGCCARRSNWQSYYLPTWS